MHPLMLCGVLLASLVFGPSLPAAESRLEKRNEAIRVSAFARALSREMPPEVRDLPRFGRIEWTVKSMPFIQPGPDAGVSGAGMVAVGSSIYFLGGFIPGGDGTGQPGHRTSRWAYRYDTKSGNWDRLPDLPGRREYTRSLASGGQVYLLGGGLQKPRPGLPYEPRDEVFRGDVAMPESGWATIPSLNVARTHMAVGAVGSHLVVVGGNRYDYSDGGYSFRTIQGVTETLDRSNLQRGWRQRTSIPGGPRGWCASVSLNGRLYVLGGLSFAKTKPGVRGAKIKYRETLAYDPVVDKWTRHADPPIAISGWEGAAYRDRYIIAIGGVARHWNDLAFVYDTRADRWLRFVKPLPVGAVLNDAGVCIIDDTIYVAGGEGPGGSHFDHFLIGKIMATP